METRELDINEKIKLWGAQKGITNPDKQTIKLMEEVGELAHEICRGKYTSDEAKDAFGDIQVVLIILADLVGVDLEQCKLDAYNVIANRTGKSVDGCFVKAE